jgi:hypothetical protein
MYTMSGRPSTATPAGRPVQDPNTVIAQYIRAAKEKIEREKAEAAIRSPNFSYPNSPQAPPPAALLSPQQSVHPASNLQYQPRTASYGAPSRSSAAPSYSDYGDYVTDQGQAHQIQQGSYSPQMSSPIGNRVTTHRRTASSNYHGQFQPIPEDRESRALSSLYAASSQAPSSQIFDDNETQHITGEIARTHEASILKPPPSPKYETGRGLVREASIGRKGRPTLTQIGSSESYSRRNSRQSSTPPEELPAGVAPSYGPQEPPPVPTIAITAGHLRIPSTESALTSRTGRMSPSASTFSEEQLKQEHESPITPRHLRPSPGAKPNYHKHGESHQSSRPFTADSANSSGSLFRFARDPDSSSLAKSSKLSERVGSKKPEPLNLGLVKDAEARGSLTSLPDLIKRALRLASNLEVGKTASRFGTDWMFEGDGEKAAQRRRNSLGSIINSFPSTPQPDSPRRRTPYSVMPRSAGLQSALRRSFTPNFNQALNSDHEKQKPHRRCCGMPLWAFLLVLLILIMLVVAAILVPVCLIVIPNSHHDGNCVKASIGSTSNAQIGSAIPDLLTHANETFGVPLNGSGLLSLFAAQKMSCSAENALVTFSSLTKRDHTHVRHARHVSVLSISTVTSASATVEHILEARQTAGTSNGIIFAMSSTVASTLAASSTTSASPASATTVTGGNTAFAPTALNLDFARTVILYIFQQTQSLDTANGAQTSLAAFFANPAAGGGQAGAKLLEVGSGWIVDRRVCLMISGGRR